MFLLSSCIVNTFDLQFHPESVATYYGRQVFENFREITEDYWTRWRASSLQGRSFNYAGNRRSYEHLIVRPLIYLADSHHLSIDFNVFVLISDVFLVNVLLPNMNHLLRLVSVQDKASWIDSGGYCLPRLCDVGERDSFQVPSKDHSTIKKRPLKLRWRKFEGLAAKIGGSDNIFCKIFTENGTENTFWLDSASTEKVLILWMNLRDTACQNLLFQF